MFKGAVKYYHHDILWTINETNGLIKDTNNHNTSSVRPAKPRLHIAEQLQFIQIEWIKVHVFQTVLIISKETL